MKDSLHDNKVNKYSTNSDNMTLGLILIYWETSSTDHHTNQYRPIDTRTTIISLRSGERTRKLMNNSEYNTSLY